MENVPKEITLKLTSFRIAGTALVAPWGGGKATIEMHTQDVDRSTIDEIMAVKEWTPKTLVKYFNDGGFGVEAILGAQGDFVPIYGGSQAWWLSEHFAFGEAFELPDDDMPEEDE